MHWSTKKPGETRTVIVPFSHKLRPGELLTGTPTVVELTTTDLTITDVAVNSILLEISGQVVRGVSFSVAGGAEGTEYVIRVTVGSDATVAQTLIEEVRFLVN